MHTTRRTSREGEARIEKSDTQIEAADVYEDSIIEAVWTLVHNTLRIDSNSLKPSIRA